jgi:hypothetical protein
MAYMSKAKTEVGVKPAPVIASLSSRGPNPIQPIILKVHPLCFTNYVINVLFILT